jgi:hypothetical protein
MTMCRVLTVLALLVAVARNDCAIAQTGIVVGDVLDGNTPVMGAVVRLDFLDPVNQHYQEETIADGRFVLTGLPEGLCSVMAMRSGLGFGSDLIEVTSGSPTYTALFLTGGEGEGELSQTFSLSGTARVVDDGSDFPRYYLDLELHDGYEYSLVFGPPWYNPDHGSAQRPSDGQAINVEVAAFNYSVVPLVVVRTVGGEYWREETEGHGAATGHFQEMSGCTTCVVTRIEADAWLDVITDPEPPDSSIAYRVTWGPERRIIFLDFGAANYTPPPGGAQRPTHSQQVHIVAGEYWSLRQGQYRAIVYEIGGAVWRLPGDTTGFGRLSESASEWPGGTPGDFGLLGNYPNPFNGQTMIHWSVDRTTVGTLDAFDLLGRRVAEIDRGAWSAGEHAKAWNCESCATGVYVLRLQTADRTQTHRVHLIR